MIKRKIEDKIINWVKNSDKALLIDGARQVGKTTAIIKVLEEQKCDYVKFNLLEDTDFASCLSNEMTKDDFLEAVTINVNRPITKGKTIIFIDEVQVCRELLTIIKFLVEDGSYKYILSGSVLGVELTRVRSVPVGYLEKEKMYPLDFEEFVSAFGIQATTINSIRKSFDNHEPVSQTVHKKMMSLFNKYLIIGGMPDAVQNFIDNRDYSVVHHIHQNIIDLYKDDFTKYQDYDKKLKLIAAYSLIPSQLNGQCKRYTFNQLNKSFRFERYEATFEWLKTAEVAIPVYNITKPTIPLIMSKNSTLFKLFLNDVGLLTSMYGIGTIKKMLAKNIDINFGALYENFVAQELHAHGYPNYYYKSKKFGEVDFVIEDDCKVLPVEVKSGKSYTRHSALDNIMTSEAFNIECAYVFSNDNVSKSTIATMDWKKKYFKIRDEYKVVYLPIYMAMFIDNLKF